MAIRSYNNEVLEEFICIYRDSPCLWKEKDKDYRNRQKREAAYGRLVAQLQKLEPTANKDCVVKKINNFRSNHRKELKKIEESKRSGCGPEELYKPKLWYFHLFDFLKERDPRCTQDYDDDWDSNGINSIEMTPEVAYSEESEDQNIEESFSTVEEFEDFSPVSESTKLHPRPSKRRSVPHQSVWSTQVLEAVKDHFKRPIYSEDRHDIFGKNVAVVLRDVSKQQRILAERLINDVLFEAQMGTLTISHALACQALTPSYPVTTPNFQHSEDIKNLNSSSNPSTHSAEH